MSKLDAYGPGGRSVEPRLRALLAYTNEPPELTGAERDALMTAIEQCAVLDPACGSGAFPMGMLQKMIHLLRGIDPDNSRWFEMVIRNFPPYMQAEVRKRLEKENWNYVRKLGIIQQCIYGVDIQPIATQIAKLRFFISLLVDQRVDRDAPNWGLEPLPNLDFKIVTANTLIAAPAAVARENDLFAGQIDPFFARFEELTGQYFTASKPDEKTRLKRKIEALLKERAAAGIRQIEQNFKTALDARYNAAKAKQHEALIADKEREIALWRSYLNLFKHEAVEFFETRYFFPNVSDGFDIVIGNPPYFNLNKVPKKFVNLLKSSYDLIHTGYNDIVYYFLYLSIELLKPNGISVLITSNYFLGNEYAQKLRNYLKSHLVKLINFKDYKVFESASIHTCISLYKKSNYSNVINYFEACHDMQVTTTSIEEQCKTFELQRNELNDTWIVAEKESQRLIKKISDRNVPLGKIAEIEQGSKSGKNDVFTVSQAQIEQYDLEKELLRKNVKNSDIQKYCFMNRNEWLIYVDNETNINQYPNILSYLSEHKAVLESRNEVKKGAYPWYRFDRPRRKKIFDADEKIIVPYRAEHNRFAYDQFQHFNNGGDIRVIVITDHRFHIKYILALLNSSLLDWYYGYIGKPKGNAREYFNTPLSKVPIVLASEQRQEIFIKLVNSILTSKQQNPAADTSDLERRIDLMVYRLYDLTYDEVKIVDPEFGLSAEEYQQFTL